MDTADPDFDPEAYLANQRLLDARKGTPAATPMGGKGPVNAAATAIPQFTPEQAPQMLPMQALIQALMSSGLLGGL